jgi:fatty-acyl-CoA synthase
MVANQVPLSPVSFLNRSAEVFADDVGVVAGDGTTVTHAGLLGRAARLAGQVRAAGVGQGERVAVLAPNDLPLLEAHYGVPAAGAVLVALNTRLSATEYVEILGHSSAGVLIVDHSLLDRLGDKLRDRVPGLKLVLEVTQGALSSVADADYETWLAEGDEAERLPLPEHEDLPIALNYTSGTTGHAKGAIYTHRGAYLAALGQALGLGLTPESVYLWTLPMFHCNGWCFTWAVTSTAARHVCMRRFEPAEALRMIGEQRVSHFCGAPVVLNSIVNDPAAETASFSHAVTVATGGAPPTPTVIERMGSLGIDVVHLYGLTETYGPSLICERQPSWAELDGAARAAVMARQGVPALQVEGVRVVDEDMADVPADATTMGEVVVRANTVMAGYLDDEEATAHAFRGGWFHSGDLAVRHPDGYVELRDRAKDIIITGGENVSSIEVENVIAAHPGVLENAVVARPDERWGEVPVAFVTPREGAEPTADEVIAWVRDRLAHFKAPRAVHFMTLPKTSTGKVRKTELRQVARNDSPSGGT